MLSEKHVADQKNIGAYRQWRIATGVCSCGSDLLINAGTTTHVILSDGALSNNILMIHSLKLYYIPKGIIS